MEAMRPQVREREAERSGDGRTKEAATDPQRMAGEESGRLIQRQAEKATSRSRRNSPSSSSPPVLSNPAQRPPKNALPPPVTSLTFPCSSSPNTAGTQPTTSDPARHQQTPSGPERTMAVPRPGVRKEASVRVAISMSGIWEAGGPVVGRERRVRASIWLGLSKTEVREVC